MTESTQDSATAYATTLLVHYCFELGMYTAEELVTHWLNNYPTKWVRLAIIEALYQGRYKAVSVDQILSSWHRRGQATFHFNHDFERIVCRQFPQMLVEKPESEPETASQPEQPDSLQETEKQTFSEQMTADVNELATSVALTEKIVFDHASTSVLAEEQADWGDEPSAEDADAKASPLGRSMISYEADWSRCEASKRPIHQFIPPTDDSEFYLKLKAVAENSEESSAESAEDSIQVE